MTGERMRPPFLLRLPRFFLSRWRVIVDRIAAAQRWLMKRKIRHYESHFVSSLLLPSGVSRTGAYLGRNISNSNFNFLQKGFVSVSDAAKFKILPCRFFFWSIELVVC